METTRQYFSGDQPIRTGIIGLLLLFALGVGTLQAQQSPLSSPLNNTEPIQITADTLEADNRNQTFVFRGHVKVVQGTTVITSEKLKVWYKSDRDEQARTQAGGSRIRDIEASGNVVILFDGRTAKSDTAVYSAQKETLTLSGDNATILDGKNAIRGSKITLYRANDRITVEGRVEAEFFPNTKDPG